MAKKKLKAGREKKRKSAPKKRAVKKSATKKAAKKKVAAKKASPKRAAKRPIITDATVANRSAALALTASAGIIDEITTLAAKSKIAQYGWLDNSGKRGRAPMAYFKGMAVVYARVYCKLKAGDPAAVDMARKKTNIVAHDVLAAYDPIFKQLGMSNDSDGVDTLRHLFVLLTGLGVRESSGYHCRGRYMDQGFDKPDDAEAGLFQTAYNLRNKCPSILEPLIKRYTDNPRPSGFLEIFSAGITCPPSDWKNWGQPSDAGYAFQQFTKTCPAFAAEYAAVGMRHSLDSWGPLRSTNLLKKPEVAPDCETLYQGVEAIMESAPGLCSQVM